MSTHYEIGCPCDSDPAWHSRTPLTQEMIDQAAIEGELPCGRYLVEAPLVLRPGLKVAGADYGSLGNDGGDA